MPDAQRQFELAVAARYPQQVTDLDIACANVQVSAADAGILADEFHDTYRARYAAAEPDSDVEFVMWRLSAIGARPAIKRKLAPRLGSANAETDGIKSQIFHDPTSGKQVDAKLFNLESLDHKAKLIGPALIVSSDAAIVLPAGSKATVAAEGHLVIDVNTGSSEI